MMMPTNQELDRIQSIAYQRAYLGEANEDAYEAHLAALGALRDAVIEALAAEAERQHGTLLVHGIPDMFGDVAYDEGMVDGYMISSWLRGHLGDTEATDDLA